jgi:hypothetical protein
MGIEDGVGRVQRRDRVLVGSRPRARPDLRPAARCGTGVYFATSMARLSRMTTTFTWPGYSS